MDRPNLSGAGPAHSALVSVAIVDDHPATLAGLQTWLAESDPPVTVLAAGATPAAAWTPPGSDADVVLLDLKLDRHPAPSYRHLKRLVRGGRRVIVYTMLEVDSIALTCLDLGAATVLTKAEGQDHLMAAIVATAQNRPYLPPSLSGSIATDARHHRPELSEREVEALVLWFQCESKHLVAQRMGVTVKTVATYLDRARIKYAVVGRPATTKAALLARAVQDGLVDLEDL